MKRTANSLTILFLAVLLAGCEKDIILEVPENQSPEIPDNRNPEKAILTSPASSATEVEPVALKLKWQQPTDPDGDAVSYDIYLDRNTPPVTVVASGITATGYTLDEELERNTIYHWKVVARDLMGGQSESEEASFTTRPDNVEELMVGKWFLESSNSGDGTPVDLSDCDKQSYLKFTDDGIITRDLYSVGSQDVCYSSSISIQYEIFNSQYVKIYVGQAAEIIPILSFTETELVLNGELLGFSVGSITTFSKAP